MFLVQRTVVVVCGLAYWLALVPAQVVAQTAKSLTLEAADAPRPLPVRMLGATTEAWNRDLVHDPQKLAALKDMQLALLRFPDGTTCNYFNWRTGLMDIQVTARSSPYARFLGGIAARIRSGMPNGISIENYTKFAKHLGAEVLLVPNLETSSVTEQVAVLRRMNSEGIAPHFIELGNEYWIATGMDPAALKRWPDEPAAMRIMKQYCDAARPNLPQGAKIAVQAAASSYWPHGSPTGEGGPRLRQWDADLKPAPWFDAVTIHPYPRINEIMESLDAAQGWSEPRQAMKLFTAILAHCDQGIDDLIADLRRRVPGKEIWITEWSTRATEFNHPEEPTPAMHIQLVSRMNFAVLRHREITVALFYAIKFSPRGAYHVFQSDGKGGYRPMPHMIAMSWFNEAANGGATYQRWVESGAPLIPGGGPLPEKYRAVEAGLFHKSASTTLLVQNCSAEPRLLDLAHLPGGKGTPHIETLATPDLSKAPETGLPARVQLESDGAVRLPAYSLTRLIWK